MESKWLTWIRDHMPADLLEEYLQDTRHFHSWTHKRIRELEEELEAEKTWIRENMETK